MAPARLLEIHRSGARRRHDDGTIFRVHRAFAYMLIAKEHHEKSLMDRNLAGRYRGVDLFRNRPLARDATATQRLETGMEQLATGRSVSLRRPKRRSARADGRSCGVRIGLSSR